MEENWYLKEEQQPLEDNELLYPTHKETFPSPKKKKSA